MLNKMRTRRSEGIVEWFNAEAGYGYTKCGALIHRDQFLTPLWGIDEGTKINFLVFHLNEQKYALEIKGVV